MIYPDQCNRVLVQLQLLVGDQLDTNLFYIRRLFQSSTCFEQTPAHHQEVNCFNTASGIVTLCKWPSGMQVEQFLLYLHTYNWPPDDEHMFAWNMQRTEINVLYKIIVRQVGHLPEVISRCTVSKILKKKLFSYVIFCGNEVLQLWFDAFSLNINQR